VGLAGQRRGQFNYPAGVATNAAGEVFVADQWNHRIQKFTSAGVYLTHGEEGWR
jgi:DNA-binding beta-propeller fold protein YncE